MVCLKRIQYATKCGIYILCLFIVIIEINKAQLTHKEMYDSNIYTVQKVPTAYYYPIIEMNDNLWKYLKEGLNYLETDGKNYSPSFIHPGGKAFGALGLTEPAIKDVINRCKGLSQYNITDVITNNRIYENFAKAYADILLRHYLKVNYYAMPAENVFDILQKAWYLGPGLYKNGEKIIVSRQQRAEEYKTRVRTNQVL